MDKRGFLIFTIFFVVFFCMPIMLFGQRVVDLDKVHGDMQVWGYNVLGLSGFALSHGDINSDGYQDIIIGAVWADVGDEIAAGHVYVIFGSQNPPSIIDLNSKAADITVYGASEQDWTGRAVASGDINGDGYDDVIFGAPNASDPLDWDGRVHVIFGSSSPPSTINLASESTDINIYGDWGDYAGWSLASGDVNNDGYDDVIIGCRDGAAGKGRTHVIFGRDFTTPVDIVLHTQPADITINGKVGGDHSGTAVASGNINNDEYDDLIIGAPDAAPFDRTRAGEVYIILSDGFSSPPYTIYLNTQAPDITVYGEAYDRPLTGHAVASGDVNNDGYNDVIIGAYLADPPGARMNAGKTYVIFGSSSPPATIDLETQYADITIHGDDADDWSAWAVAGGNVNGDSYDDVLIYTLYAGDGTGGGEAYVIFGRSFSPPVVIDLDTQSADITVLGKGWDLSGVAVASGDVNDDGYDDLIIGDCWADTPGGEGAGKTYVIFGGKSVPVDVVAGQGPGAASFIRDFNAQKGNIWNTTKAFGGGNANGEVSVAKGDVTGDAIAEIVVGQRSMGASSWVRVFTQDGELLWSFQAFGPGNTNGMVNVAVGDVDVDGVGEIVVGQGPGGDSYVRVFEYKNPNPITTWKAFGGGNTSGEIRVAAGQIRNGVSVGQIITGQGHGGDSYVRVWDYGTPKPSLHKTFRAFGPGNTSGGIDVGIGDLDGDGGAKGFILVGQGGPGQTAAAPADSYIRVFTEAGALLKTLKAFGPGNVNGRVTVSGGQADGDSADEIMVGQAVGGNSFWRAFNEDGSLIRTVKAFGGGNTNGQVDVAAAK